MEQVHYHSAGIIVYYITREEISLFLLLQHRNGNHWDFPKGKIEPGEQPHDAALRELAEETSIVDMTLISDHSYTFTYTFVDHDHVSAYKTVTLFVGKTSQEHVHLSGEHIAFAWCTHADALKLLTHQNTQAALNWASRLI